MSLCDDVCVSLGTEHFVLWRHASITNIRLAIVAFVQKHIPETSINDLEENTFCLFWLTKIQTNISQCKMIANRREIWCKQMALCYQSMYSELFRWKPIKLVRRRAKPLPIATGQKASSCKKSQWNLLKRNTGLYKRKLNKIYNSVTWILASRFQLIWAYNLISYP